MSVKTVILHFFCILLIYFGSARASLQEKPPLIECQSANDVIPYKQGDSVFIPCKAKGENVEMPTHEYRWMKNGANVSDLGSMKKSENQNCNYGLHIENFDDSDEGKYQCFVSNERGTAMSKPVILQKVKIPESPNSIRSLDAIEGKPFNFSCILSNDSMYFENKYWAYQVTNNRVTSYTKINNTRITEDPDGVLWFSWVEKSDASNSTTTLTYVTEKGSGVRTSGCVTNLRVINESASDYTQLKKQYVSKKDQYVVLGEEKRLFCIYGGKSDITWKKDDTILMSGGNVQISESQKYIDIKNITREEQGEYSCEVRKTKEENIQHTHNFTIKIGKPYFIKGPEEIVVLEGNAIKLDCEVYDGEANNEKQDVAWIFNAQPIKDCVHFEDIKFDGNSLTIPNVQEKHIGTYGCNVSNTFGYVYQEGYIYVEKKQPPEILNDNSNVNTTITINEGESVNWTCSVMIHNSQDSSITWMKNNENLSNYADDSRITISKEKQLIQIRNFHSNDSGEYFCIVYYFGEEFTRLGFNLTLRTPDLPKLTPHSDQGNSKLTIIWLIVILIIVAIIVAVVIIGKKRGFGAQKKTYDIERRENRAGNQPDSKTCEENEVSLLAGGSPNNGTLNLNRRSTQNGITLAEVNSGP